MSRDKDAKNSSNIRDRLTDRLSEHKLFENFFLKVISFLLGFVVWLVVVNIDNPNITRTYTVTEVQFLNEAYIDSTGMMAMSKMDTANIKVRLTASRKTLQSIRSADLRVTADLQQAISLDTNPVMVPLTVDCGHEGVEVEVSPSYYSITLDEKKTQEFVVNVTAGESKPSSGYEIGELISDQEKIRITGPSSLISNIETVTAHVNVDGIAQDTTQTVSVSITDKNGDAMTDAELSYLIFNREVSVTVRLWKVRSNVNVDVEEYGTPADGYKVDGLVTTPDTISVCGTTAALETLAAQNNQILIPAGVIDVTGKTKDFEQAVNIVEYLPTGIKLASGISEDVYVKVLILPDEAASYTIITKDIEVKNCPDKLQAAFETESIEVRVRPTAADDEAEGQDSPKELALSDIKASVDLSDQKEGTFEVPVSVELPKGYELVNDPTVEIRISKITTAAERSRN